MSELNECGQRARLTEIDKWCDQPLKRLEDSRVRDCFFFSSRRRHTRFDCDWSSDVCSSDLQIWSVLMGDLSFVGPRPALYNQDDLVELRTRYGIHELAPGVTGWAQINGRDE